MTIDLRTCHKGDQLKLRNGDVAEYDQPISKENYPHRIKLRDVHHGYMDDGTFIHDREHSFAVVEILPRKSAPIFTVAQLASAERHLDATVRAARAAVAYCGDRSGIMPNYIRLCDAVTDYIKYAEKRREAKK